MAGALPQSGAFDSPARAAATGDADALRAMIAAGADINWRDPSLSDATALEIALQRRDLPMMRLLLELGADPCAPYGGWKSSCVMKSVAGGYIDGLRLLVDEFGHTLTNPYNAGDSGVLQVAVGAADRDPLGALAMLRHLIEDRGLDATATDANGVTPARLANNPNRPTAVLEYLYSKGAVTFGTQEASDWFSIPPDARPTDKFGQPLPGISDDLDDSLALIDRFTNKTTLLNQSVYDADAKKVRIHLKNGASALVADAGGVTPYDLLDILKKRERYKPEHDAVKTALDESVARRPKRKPMPQP